MPKNNNYQNRQNNLDMDILRKFKSEWITKGADEDLVSFADEVGKKFKDFELSQSQVRNVYGEIKRIQLKGIDCSEGKSSFALLKPKVAYAYGRNKGDGLLLFKEVFDKGWDVVQSNMTKQTYNNFCNLLEAILAYHRSYGGK